MTTKHRVVTPRGITMGSTMDDVLNAYGVPQDDEMGDEDLYCFWYEIPRTKGKRLLVIWIEKQTESVVQIEALP